MVQKLELISQELLQTLQNYIKASKEGNYPLLRTLLHPDARIYYSDTVDSRKLTLHWEEIPPHLKEIDPVQLQQKTRMKINSVIHYGNVAHVSISMLTYFDYHYIDYLAFLWVKDQWKLLTKVSHLIQTPDISPEEISGKETQEVMKFIDKYIEICYQLDFKQMRQLAHPESRIFIGGKTMSKNLHQHWQEDEKKFQGRDLIRWSSGKKIYPTHIEVDHKVAIVKLQFNDRWYDFHQLVKIDSKWFFVNKISQPILASVEEI